ncbi:MAG: hypothetical protein EOP87_20645, partial [Verrucomicrobiaceae bacterium]
MTTCPEKGSSFDMKSKAAFSFSSGTFHATSAPWASFVESSVWRTRRTTPASTIARMRSITVSSGTPDFSAMTWKGWRWKPETRSSEMADEILRRLRYPNDTVDAVVPMVARHMQFMHVQQMRTAKLKRFMSGADFPLEMELHRVDCGSSNGFTDNYVFLQAKEAEFAAAPLIPPPLVTGRDLISLGLKPGPRFKEILEMVETEQLEGRILDRDAALDYL